jgi:catechol 2,3-dioxygenase-like lactoylglutathione lyase family enzyme
VPHPGEARPADQSRARRPWHHSFVIAHEGYPAALDHLRAHDVEITFEEDRQGGVVNGPRAYFHDPDGTVLEFIDLTSYAGIRS